MNNIDKFFNKNKIVFAKEYIAYLTEILKSIDLEQVSRFIEILLDARKSGATIFFIGNGGSAATASHFANDIAIGTNSYHLPFRALSLTDNQAIITALGNDIGYEEIFSKQLQVLARSGDVLVSISASGNSLNLINAVNYARDSGIKTFSITAFDGGKLKQISDDGIHIQTEFGEYGPAEDVHMVLDHLVGAYLIRAVKTT